MKAIGFYAGGAATIVGAIWIAVNRFWPAKPNKKPPKPTPQTNISSSNGIAGGGDVTIDGNVTISQTPKSAWGLLGLGIVCLALVGLFGGDSTNVTNGVVVKGDVTGSEISVGE